MTHSLISKFPNSNILEKCSFLLIWTESKEVYFLQLSCIIHWAPPHHIYTVNVLQLSYTSLMIESLPITFILWYQSLLINMHDITLFETGWIVWLVYLGMSGVCHCFYTNTSTELTYKSLLNLLIYSHETEKINCKPKHIFAFY